MIKRRAPGHTLKAEEHPSTLRKAVAYNNKQGITKEQWLTIRQACQARPCESVVVALIAWQRTKGLEADGMIGPKTREALGLKDTFVSKPLGIWYDRAPKTSDAQKLKALGFDMVNLMFNYSEDNKRNPKLKWDTAKIAPLVEALIALDISVGATAWVHPNKEYIDNLLDAIAKYPDKMLDRIEFDIEGNWRSKHGDIDKWGAYLMREVRERFPRSKIGASTYIYHAEYSAPGGLVSRESDYICIQAYSKNETPWDHKYGPGNKQTLAASRLANVLNSPPQHMGLGAWRQKWPGRTIDEALEVALDAAFAADVKGIWYWSAKHILRKGSRVAKALRRIQDASK